MKLSRQDRSWCRQYAESNGLNSNEVVKAIVAYFDDMVIAVRSLPFNNVTRIYTADAVDKLAPVYNIPCLGRIGPIYSLYLKWRREEAKEQETELREVVKRRHLSERIEQAAAMALSGRRVSASFLDDPIPRGMYRKVWIIDANGKRRVARQVYKKQ